MRKIVLLVSAALAATAFATPAQAGSCEVEGVRFTGLVCTAKCIVEAGDPFVLCTQ